ncbi:response regulator transcription factor [Pelosinus propionicus]|uniref:Two-component system, response regulator YesN n=1 Tax=Pelosinus propionicus DSM 13327 TaxID=1123291 RepID=A0A1I4H434_9FIRM|nr:response regulator [Pelosinus propionicus]SFL36560.1 two-component system, response regulator YesN [Pelosinus propionicus DSM 13327]
MYTLLIVDDEQLERQALHFIVSQKCPTIKVIGETGDGKSAVQIAATHKPDIVLMDIRMPEMNGLEAAKRIRALSPDTIIIMLTAFDEFSYAKQALTIGVVEYLLKPVRPDDIMHTLELTIQRVEELKRKKQEEASLRKSVEDAIPFIQMSFVYDLISGNIKEMEHFQERSRFLGMRVDPGVVLVIDVDNFKQLTSSDSELEKQMIKQKIHKLISSVAGDDALVTPFGSDNLIVLLGFAEVESEERIKDNAHKVAADIQECIAQAMNISITIGIGRYYDDPREIHKSYLEALHAQRQRFYLGDSQIIHVEDVPYLTTGPFNYPFHYERNVLDKVRCGDRKQAKEALHELLDGIFSSKANMDTIKACVLELLIVLSRSAVEGGANIEQLTLLNLNCINHLNECNNKTQVEAWMLASLDHFMDNMLENRSSMNLRVINKACDYIVKNYHKNISLEEVAQTVHLSPFYFSRLFKQEKGYNFVDFLTKVRIEKAKKMLQNPDFTAVRIAAEVGYQDASYFSRVFRQTMGMTPNQYRNEFRNTKQE